MHVRAPTGNTIVVEGRAMNRKYLLALTVLCSLTSCAEEKLPGGYHVRVADRGKAWLHDPDNFVVLNYVTAVGHDDRRIFSETRKLRDQPPYGYANCKYYVTDTVTRKTIEFLPKNALELRRIKEKVRNLNSLISSKSCIK